MRTHHPLDVDMLAFVEATLEDPGRKLVIERHLETCTLCRRKALRLKTEILSGPKNFPAEDDGRCEVEIESV